MISIKKVLFPTDFSECADAALPWAVAIAKNFESELTMFHAVVLHGDDVGDEVYSRFPDFDKIIQIVMKNANTRLDQTIPDKDEVSIRQRVGRGISAADEILDLSIEEEMDLIVLGTHGRKGLRHLILGSVAEQVVRYAPCPVLTVRCPSDGPSEYADLKRIVLPVDFSEHSKLAARYAVALAEKASAELVVMHVIDQTVHPSFYSVGKESLLELDLELQNRTKAAIVEFMVEAGAKIDFGCEVAEGKPAAEITRYADANKDSLIIIASHGAGAMERLLMGSTAERVVRMAESPVLVVKLGERDFVT